MKTLDNLYEILEDELKKIAKKSDISPQELENAYKVVDILKDIETIKAMKQTDFGGEGEYSQGRQSYDNMGNSNRGSYGPIWNQDNMMPYSMNRQSYDGMSNRGSYDGRAGRDADNDGRYSEDGSYDYSGRRGRDSRGRYTSRDGSYEYSRHSEKERMIDKLETMADVATDTHTKRAIEQCITKLEQ